MPCLLPQVEIARDIAGGEGQAERRIGEDDLLVRLGVQRRDARGRQDDGGDREGRHTHRQILPAGRTAAIMERALRPINAAPRHVRAGNCVRCCGRAISRQRRHDNRMPREECDEKNDPGRARHPDCGNKREPRGGEAQGRDPATRILGQHLGRVRRGRRLLQGRRPRGRGVLHRGRRADDRHRRLRQRRHRHVERHPRRHRRLREGRRSHALPHHLGGDDRRQRAVLVGQGRQPDQDASRTPTRARPSRSRRRARRRT